MLIPYNPLRGLNKWFDDDDFFLPEIWGKQNLSLNPKVNIYEEKGNVIAEFEMPGLKSEEIEVEVEKDQIKVKAEKKENRELKDKGYYRKEINSALWQRIIPLPKEVNEKSATAEYENGVLRVKAPLIKREDKQEKQKVKVIGK
ncbi:Hsp20/alpha crystallin family protein [Candidatus Gribaldobacteria bacterium]|nr:Hsp20/alpha crystallin family protein [Candidatus Gribaldobacteria bacterium]